MNQRLRVLVLVLVLGRAAGFKMRQFKHQRRRHAGCAVRAKSQVNRPERGSRVEIPVSCTGSLLVDAMRCDADGRVVGAEQSC